MTWSGYSESGQGSQERGPGTFSTPAPRPVLGNAPTEAAGDVNVRGGVRFIGNGTASVGRVTPGSAINLPEAGITRDRTLDTLLSLGQKFLAPKIEQVKKEAEVAGAVRHASGVALEEIINEQPWYANVFGTAPAVEGARTYAAKAATAKFVSAHLENMDQLAQMSPDEVAPYLNQQISNHLTGEAGADALIKGEIVAQLPVLVKAHTKAHVGYMQRKADAASKQAMIEAATKYGIVQKDEYQVFTDEDRQLAQIELAEAFMLPEGRNPDTHWANVGKTVIEQATAGNTQFLMAAAQAGILDAMPVEHRDVVQQAFVKAAPMVYSRMLLNDKELLQAVTAWQTLPDDNVDARLAARDRINELAAQRSGIPLGIATLLDSGDTMRALGMDLRAQQQEQHAGLNLLAQQQKELQEQIKQERDRAVYRQSILADIDDPAVSVKIRSGEVARKLGIKQEDANAVWTEVVNSRTPAELGALLNRVPVDNIPAVTARFQQWRDAASRPESRESWEAGWYNMVEAAKNVSSKEVLALHMGTSGDKWAARAFAVRDMHKAGTPLLAAITMVNNIAPAQEAANELKQATKEDVVKARKIIDEVVSSTMGDSMGARMWRGLTGGRQVAEHHKELLAGIVSSLGANGHLPSQEENFKYQLNSLRANGDITVAGGGFVINTSALDARDPERSLSKTLGFNPGMEDTLHEALFLTVEDKLGELGYGRNASAFDTLSAAARYVTPAGIVQQSAMPRQVGFEATGYVVSRMPAAKDSKEVEYMITYQHEGRTRSARVTSSDVLTKYNAMIGTGQKPATTPVGVDSTIVPSGMIPE